MKTYLEPHEITALEAEAGNPRDRLLIRLLFHLGCRVSEALGLTVEDVDLEGGTVVIQHLKTRLKLSCTGCGHSLGRSHTFCPGCGGKIDKVKTEQQHHHRQRVLPIDPNTLSILREYIERGGPVLRGGKRLIFGINRHRAWQIITECAGRVGLPKLINPETGKVHNVSPHKLRDAFATHAVKLNDSGDGLRLLQEHLGHTSFNTTAKYRKVAGEEHKAWYEKLWTNGEGKKQGGFSAHPAAAGSPGNFSSATAHKVHQ
ncbi:MAG: tyrosine-type recombinase/integrase [Dehalococcoidia bacterium]|nr:tyrosine-type recombinase/integrase [Dehalococcoidia bacterium]